MGGKGIGGEKQEVLSCKRKIAGTGIFHGLVVSFLMALTKVSAWGMKKRATVQRAGGQMEQDGEVCF